MDFFNGFDVRSLENLEILAQQVVEGFIIGLHKSPFHGFSVEFAEHRLYNQGESTKDIDWKVYARTDKMFTKKFEEETNLRCQILIDTSSSMRYKNASNASGLNKLEYSAVAAASIMNLLKKQRDAFGISLFDTSVHIHTPCKSSTAHYRLLLTYLDTAIRNVQKNITTSVAEALHQIADTIHRRSLVLIFSDMLGSEEDLENVFSALQHLKFAKHEVVVFHVQDKEHEFLFEFEDRPYLFVDMESGEEVRLQQNEVQLIYQARMADYMNTIKQKCMQYRIDFVDTNIREGYIPILQKYLAKRMKLH